MPHDLILQQVSPDVTVEIRIQERERKESRPPEAGTGTGSLWLPSHFISQTNHKASPESRGTETESKSWWKNLKSHSAKNMDTGRSPTVAINSSNLSTWDLFSLSSLEFLWLFVCFFTWYWIPCITVRLWRPRQHFNHVRVDWRGGLGGAGIWVSTGKLILQVLGKLQTGFNCWLKEGTVSARVKTCPSDALRNCK